MKALILILITSLSIFGGSNTKIVKTRHEFTLNGSSRVVTFNDEIFLASSVDIVKDSVYVTLRSNGETLFFKRSEIERIEKFMNNGIRNAIIGGVAGAVWSLITASQWNDDDNSGYTIYWSAIIGGLGGGIGYVIGTFQSGEFNFIFEGNKNAYNIGSIP